jgi:putative component of membrane protein insertase Oxa1/YidC/SpoIIIJ protein YidD
LQKYGFIKGVELGFRRILKCHPFKKLGGDHGVDFVPSLKKGNKNG